MAEPSEEAPEDDTDVGDSDSVDNAAGMVSEIDTTVVVEARCLSLKCVFTVFLVSVSAIYLLNFLFDDL